MCSCLDHAQSRVPTARDEMCCRLNEAIVDYGRIIGHWTHDVSIRKIDDPERSSSALKKTAAEEHQIDAIIMSLQTPLIQGT